MTTHIIPALHRYLYGSDTSSCCDRTTRCTIFSSQATSLFTAGALAAVLVFTTKFRELSLARSGSGIVGCGKQAVARVVSWVRGYGVGACDVDRGNSRNVHQRTLVSSLRVEKLQHFCRLGRIVSRQFKSFSTPSWIGSALDCGEF